MREIAYWGGLLAATAIATAIAIRSAIAGLVAKIGESAIPDVIAGYAACLLLGGVISLALTYLGKHLGAKPTPQERRLAFAYAQPGQLNSTNVFVPKVVVGEPKAPTTDTFEFRVSDPLIGLRAKTIPKHLVRRFFDCETPTRKEWSGAAESYSDVVAVARHYGWIVGRTDGRKGYSWAAGWNSPQRRVKWLEMMESR